MLKCDPRHLTDDVELDDVTLLRIGRDLALVLAFVAFLDVFHLERPAVHRVHEKRLEPFIRDKHGSIYGEDMRVPSSDPRHLSRTENKQDTNRSLELRNYRTFTPLNSTSDHASFFSFQRG